MSFGLHHLSARRQAAFGVEPYPSAHIARRVFDYAMYAVGVVQPAALVPQIVSIYAYRQTAGISLATWIAFTCFNSLWAVYGHVHGDRLIFAGNLLFVCFDLAIVAGVLAY
ncbi:MAG: hypothetical protein KGI78_00960 [Patescibacteria group bacterium]|nr:hypothetical protein [Patescibacteria group bacterium]MDE1944491.1 hypothetical protein [Patescibacteria group bacterium]MDE1944983.1 hypothetical protein [Patescibacteria group bacterium]MDE2057406.1 hypothetical protein [Patescibacteria group bacterium]